MHERKFRNRRNLHCSDCCCVHCLRLLLFVAIARPLSSLRCHFRSVKYIELRQTWIRNKKITTSTTRTKKWGSKQIKNMCHLKWLMLSLFFLLLGRTISFIGWSTKNTEKIFVYRLHSVCNVYLWKALERKQKRKVEIIQMKKAKKKTVEVTLLIWNLCATTSFTIVVGYFVCVWACGEWCLLWTILSTLHT